MDELVELNGTKRNVLLADSEEREVGSATRGSGYVVKRTFDHHHCSPTLKGLERLGWRPRKHLHMQAHQSLPRRRLPTEEP